ncbi:MAG: DUF3429 domain-containing protein [Elsteraceae bacterium]
MQRPPVPRTAALLGFSGVIPFAALAAAVWAAPPAYLDLLIDAQIAYGAAILSFLGAAHWGACLNKPQPEAARLIWSVIPSLLAWIGLLLPPVYGLATLIAGVIACYAVDERAVSAGFLPLWYSGLRQPLSLLVCLMLALTLLKLVL